MSNHTDFKNLINEEEDVLKAYTNVVRQKEQAVKYIGKVSLGEQDAIKALYQVVVDHNQIHSNFYSGSGLFLFGLFFSQISTQISYSSTKNISLS